jgi:catechol 2,3-dioxygenase-like lactoylglutathione lyase family enzyme
LEGETSAVFVLPDAIVAGQGLKEIRKMLASGKVMGFVPTKDSAKARSFYEEKLGFQFVSDDMFALVMRAGETMIRIAKAKDFTPAQYTVLGWEVSNIEEMVAWLQKRGVAFEKYPWVQDKSGIWTAPGGDKVAWFKDPDGNVLSVSQHV